MTSIILNIHVRYDQFKRAVVLNEFMKKKTKQNESKQATHAPKCQ